MQLVDNLKPSERLYEVASDVVRGVINYSEAEAKLTKHYSMKDDSLNSVKLLNEKEADIVPLRIAKLLNDNDFRLTIAVLLDIHRSLFQEVFDYPLDKYIGKFRDVNISKNEDVLYEASVIYTGYQNIKDYLEYDIAQENNRVLLENVLDISKLAKFISGIWGIHPFREGNTRTTAVFLAKYLKSKDIEVNNEMFKEHSKYFRDALVLSSNNELRQPVDYSYLESFLTKLLIDKDAELKQIKIT